MDRQLSNIDRIIVNRKIIFKSSQAFQFFLQMNIFEYLKEKLPVPVWMLMQLKQFEDERIKRVNEMKVIVRE